MEAPRSRHEPREFRPTEEQTKNQMQALENAILEAPAVGYRGLLVKPRLHNRLSGSTAAAILKPGGFLAFNAALNGWRRPLDIGHRGQAPGVVQLALGRASHIPPHSQCGPGFREPVRFGGPVFFWGLINGSLDPS